MCESLAKLTEGKEDWNQHIAPVLFAYRTAKQSSTKMTPFYLVYGRHPQLPTMDTSEVIENNILDKLFCNKIFYLQFHFICTFKF